MPELPSKHLLVVHGGHAGGRTHRLVQAVQLGVLATEEAVEVRTLPALTAGVDDLLWAHGLLIGTPEHFGYMAGAVKDFMDRTFYPVEGKVDGLPYAVFVSASNELGEFESGVTAQLFGATRAVLLGGLGTLFVVFGTAWAFPVLRRIDRVDRPAPVDDTRATGGSS